MPLIAGDRLGPYVIEAPIGSGGMGDVYRARDTRLDRAVAIKIVGGAFGDRFEREARAISALNHPHICTLHDVGREGDTAYLVMELVEGTHPRGPLPVDTTIRYGIQICSALEAANKAGIVHRDLKPANVIVTRQGVKLLDFGLAKRQVPVTSPADGATAAVVTAAHRLLGTMPYMSPEQMEGREADTRSDIFALGCGQHPQWTNGGRELPYLNDEHKLFAAEIIRTDDQLTRGRTRALFGGNPLPALPGSEGDREGQASVYLTPDGMKIALAVPTDLDAVVPPTLVTNWR